MDVSNRDIQNPTCLRSVPNFKFLSKVITFCPGALECTRIPASDKFQPAPAATKQRHRDTCIHGCTMTKGQTEVLGWSLDFDVICVPAALLQLCRVHAPKLTYLATYIGRPRSQAALALPLVLTSNSTFKGSSLGTLHFTPPFQYHGFHRPHHVRRLRRHQHAAVAVEHPQRVQAHQG
jgi:hypothetical protein